VMYLVNPPAIRVVPRIGFNESYPALAASKAEVKVTVVEDPAVLTVPTNNVMIAGPLLTNGLEIIVSGGSTGPSGGVLYTLLGIFNSPYVCYSAPPYIWAVTLDAISAYPCIVSKSSTSIIPGAGTSIITVSSAGNVALRNWFAVDDVPTTPPELGTLNSDTTTSDVCVLWSMMFRMYFLPGAVLVTKVFVDADTANDVISNTLE
jgi:hypothetical protein